MVRRVLAALLRAILNLFFRKIELAGLERVPAQGPVVFVINHPNALVDPLFLLGYLPRPVSLLAKAPLFRMPVIGWLARALDSIPVYRRQDPGTAMEQNRITFARARTILEGGGTIAVAPEGTSHSDSKLRPLKTGIARIVLGAGLSQPIAIVPIGLIYTRKQTFRSDALVYFGTPLVVEPVAAGPDAEPPADRVDGLTERIGQALANVVLQADEQGALELAERAERILTAAGATDGRSLADAVSLRQRILAGYGALRERAPLELERITRQLERVESSLAAAAVDPRLLEAGRYTGRGIAAGTARFVGRALWLVPFAIPGLVIHYPAYWLIGRLATKAVRGADDVVATAKIIGAAIFFPLTWLVVGLLVGHWLGFWAGLVAWLGSPFTGLAALKLAERTERFATLSNAAGLYLLEPDHFASLAQQRDAFRADLRALADRMAL